MLIIEKYLPKSYLGHMNLRQAVVGFVLKQNAQKAMLAIKNLPTQLQQCSHLKRVNKSQQDSDMVELLLCFEDEKEQKQLILQQLEQFIVKTDLADVPSDPPNTKEDYNQWSQYWPINFIEHPIYKPLQHSLQEELFLAQILKNKEQLIIFDTNERLFTMPIGEGCQDGTINHPVMKMLELWPQSMNFAKLPQAYYLTKLRLFCSCQLCGMCSMALVHSRLERIYFPYPQVPEPSSEILCCQKLNHKVVILTVAEK